MGDRTARRRSVRDLDPERQSHQPGRDPGGDPVAGADLDRKGDLDIDRWRGELEARRGETKERIRKSAGRLAKQRAADVDALIDKS